jgi:hypothetical protein
LAEHAFYASSTAKTRLALFFGRSFSTSAAAALREMALTVENGAAGEGVTWQ